MKLTLKKKAEIMIYLNLALSFLLLGVMLYLFAVSPGLTVTLTSLVILFSILTFIGFFTVIISLEKFYTSFIQAVQAVIKEIGH